MTDPWEDHAEWWQREFTDGADPEYTEQILPLIHEHLPQGGLMLDVGCGEGQVARMATELNAMKAIGVDPAMTQVRVGAERGAARSTCRDQRPRSALVDGSVDAAVACLVFEHIADVDARSPRWHGCCGPAARSCSC